MDVKKVVSEMTLEEKVSYLSGATSWTTDEIGRLGVPAIFMCDGPHGLRKQDLAKTGQADIYNSIDAVCFPTASATAASFDRDLMQNLGVTLGKECQAENIAILLGPAVNIKRSPLCGRNFEYISEDPFLAGEMAASYIQGVQSQHVGTSIKHFAANNQETERMYASSDVDERTLREIYLTAFEIAVKKAKPWTVMASYNRVNDVYSSENRELLTDILRKEWGFDGFVMSDWGAVSDRVKGVLAGLNLEMPSSGKANDAAILQAVRSGQVPEGKVDELVAEILNVADRFLEHREREVFDRSADHEKAVRAEEQCIVLLKNDPVHSKEKALPLKKEEKVAFIGGFAATPRFQGGGSSHIHAHEVISAVSLKDEYGTITYTEGFPADRDEADPEKFAAAEKAAAAADKIVVFAGLPDLFESEGYDRTYMRLPDAQNQLIEKLLETGKPVIVVLHNGSPVELPWNDQADAVVEAYLGGEGVGQAVMNVLYGRVNPSGKLAESFPVKLSDNPSYLNFPVHQNRVAYAEGVFVGYRYYDTKEMPVRYPFGHGLSYTKFTYSDLKLSGDTFDIRKGVDVSVTIENTGRMAGKETVQLYVADRTETAVRPVHELKGFEKVSLAPGEKKTVTFHLGARAFQWYAEKIHDWHAENGTYEIQIGASSRDIRLSRQVTLTGSRQIPPRIDQDVQIGDLLRYDPTAAYVRERYLSPILEFAEVDKEEDMDPMSAAMIRYMPLRSFKSFIHMTSAEVEQTVSDLQKIVDQAENKA